ncbi:MAG: hypothetical protein ACYCPT_09155 [Acidimicrobiales bacterium]
MTIINKRLYERIGDKKYLDNDIKHMINNFIEFLSPYNNVVTEKNMFKIYCNNYKRKYKDDKLITLADMDDLHRVYLKYVGA